jgi:hypothetical protein
MTVDLDRVVKLLNLTTSDNDNESLAAARAAEGKKSAMCYRYIGNKTRLTEWIVCEIGLQPASRADLASLVLTIGLILPMTMSLALSAISVEALWLKSFRVFSILAWTALTKRFFLAR